MKKFLVPILIGGVLIAAGGFYGGLVFGKSQTVVPTDLAANFAGGPPTGGLGRTAGALPTDGEFSNGKILSLDENSLTIELPDGGSKIIYFSNSTEIVKTVVGSANDLSADEQISVTGTKNDDGSITAKNIQLRPEVVWENIK